MWVLHQNLHWGWWVKQRGCFVVKPSYQCLWCTPEMQHKLNLVSQFITRQTVGSPGHRSHTAVQPQGFSNTAGAPSAPWEGEGGWKDPLLPHFSFNYRGHKSASKGREKLRVKPVEVLEKPHQWCYCWLLTAGETHATLSAWTTFWMLHFKLLFVWSCCP